MTIKRRQILKLIEKEISDPVLRQAFKNAFLACIYAHTCNNGR